jgi:nicotinate-nucleotide adenylyltransferase
MNEPGRQPDSVRRVAFFGGSFDPPHLGHLAVARAAQVALELDTVLFAPVGAQPLKMQGSTASFEDRLRMTRLAIAGEPGFAISLADAPRPGGEPNYTLETLERLGAELGPDCALFLLMGADSLLGLRKWHRAAEIPFAASLIVASRPGQQLKDIQAALPSGLAIEAGATHEDTRGGVTVRRFLLSNEIGNRTLLYLLPGLDEEASATQIRAEVHEGDEAGSVGNAESGLPEAVAEYVHAHGLYR